jgi:hypothetical protein
MNRRLLSETIASIEANAAALNRPAMPGLPGGAARCGIVAESLRLLAEDLRMELDRCEPSQVRHSPSCLRDEDGVVEVCDPDCVVRRAEEGAF